MSLVMRYFVNNVFHSITLQKRNGVIETLKQKLIKQNAKRVNVHEYFTYFMLIINKDKLHFAHGELYLKMYFI